MYRQIRITMALGLLVIALDFSKTDGRGWRIGTNGARSGTSRSGPIRTFLTEETPTWSRLTIRRHRRSGGVGRPRHLVGGKDALDAAVARTQAYGRLGLLIPGRRLTPADLEEFAQQPGRRPRVAILAGRYDQANLPTAQAIRQALTQAGHTVDFIEVPEDHNASTWRNHLSDVLVSLFGGVIVDR
jgi:hypothetical protein